MTDVAISSIVTLCRFVFSTESGYLMSRSGLPHSPKTSHLRCLLC